MRDVIIKQLPNVRMNALTTLKTSRVYYNWKLLCCEKLVTIDDWWGFMTDNWWSKDVPIRFLYVNISRLFYFKWAQHILDIFLFRDLLLGEPNEDKAS